MIIIIIIVIEQFQYKKSQSMYHKYTVLSTIATRHSFKKIQPFCLLRCLKNKSWFQKRHYSKAQVVEHGLNYTIKDNSIK